MFVTATKKMTEEEIIYLTYEELKELELDRVQEWLINPCKILAEQDHTGWAIMAILAEAASMLGIEYIKASMWDASLSGDIEEKKKYINKYAVYNPHKYLEFVEEGMVRLRNTPRIPYAPEFEGNDEFTNLALEEFRKELILKARALSQLV